MEKIKVLHISGPLVRSGVGTSLINLLRKIDRDKFQMDFLVKAGRDGYYNEEAEQLGSNLIPVKTWRMPWCPTNPMAREVRKACDGYDIVHSHAFAYCGYVLKWALQAGVKVRISHSRMTPTWINEGPFYNKLIHYYSKVVTNRYVTHGLAVSPMAAEAKFGPDWREDKRISLHSTCTDFTPFREDVNRKEVRKELGLPLDSYVFGHVGWINDQKNHTFLIKVFEKYALDRPEAHLALVGDMGRDVKLKQKIVKQIDNSPVRDRVHMIGKRNDVPRLMKGAFDFFLFPSNHEGLGLVAIEAQAAGLPVLASTAVPQEATVIDGLVHYKSLENSLDEWVAEVDRIRTNPSPLSQEEALDLVEQSDFNVNVNVKKLEMLYLKAMRNGH